MSGFASNGLGFAIASELQWAEGKGFIALIGMELVAHVYINRADKVEEKGVEVCAGSEAGGNGRFRKEVEYKTMWHG